MPHEKGGCEKISANASDQNEDIFRIKAKPRVQCKSSSNALRWETAQSAARRTLGHLRSSLTITKQHKKPYSGDLHDKYFVKQLILSHLFQQYSRYGLTSHIKLQHRKINTNVHNKMVRIVQCHLPTVGITLEMQLM